MFALLFRLPSSVFVEARDVSTVESVLSKASAIHALSSDLQQFQKRWAMVVRCVRWAMRAAASLTHSLQRNLYAQEQSAAGGDSQSTPLGVLCVLPQPSVQYDVYFPERDCSAVLRELCAFACWRACTSLHDAKLALGEVQGVICAEAVSNEEQAELVRAVGITCVCRIALICALCSCCIADNCSLACPSRQLIGPTPAEALFHLC